MDGVNQNSQVQQQPPQDNQPKQNNQVSDKQANDFADKIKEQQGKNKKGEKADGKQEDMSLESLMAERRKNAKDTVQGRLKDQSKDDGRGDRGDRNEHFNQGQIKESTAELGLAKAAETQIKADVQIRETQQAQSAKEVNAILQKMADQIHVSAKGAANGAEIRIQLKDNILPGTEVRIHRHGGELTVTMNTTSAEANNFLASHEASLQKTLAEKFANEKVQVNINLSGDQNPDGEGRSRNEYVAEDDDQDDNN